MSAVIPSRTDKEANQRALDAVAGDKKREAEQGYDGTWVAHPDSVEVAMEEFDKVLGDRPNQLDKLRDDVAVTDKDLLAVGETPGTATVEGLANDVNVGIQYISSWLRGNGAAGIYGLMEDAATAEIARGQVWQWIRHSITLDNGQPVTPELVREMCTQELAKIREEIGDDAWFEREGRPDLSRAALRVHGALGRRHTSRSSSPSPPTRSSSRSSESLDRRRRGPRPLAEGEAQVARQPVAGSA